MGNQASVGLKSFEDLAKGSTVDVFSGLASTLSGAPNWHQFTSDWSNFGGIVAGIGNPNNSTIQNILNPPSQAMKNSQEAAAAQTERDATQYRTWTATNHVVNSNFSGQMSNITRPSHIAAIMDPTYKMAIASSRGAGRNTVNQQGQLADQSAAHSLWQTSAGGGGGSKTINSAGGTGMPLQEDAVSKPVLYPKVNTTENHSNGNVVTPN